ncbi:hypothetical protein [Trebonia sp.]|uniref:hypothetical protein n=1 Tax=Trebonia sp. TaxID=2767075 RepID=UPI002614A067|nr:hypothetical protein [Trebonia sp.]
MEALADTGAEMTAMVRVEAKAADLPGAPRHMVASFDDPPPAAFLCDFDRIFLLSPEQEEQAELETVFTDAVAAAGRRDRPPAAHCQDLPRRLPGSGLRGAEAIRLTGTISAPAGQGRVGWIAAADVARVAARVLTSPGHENMTYVLTGPDALGYADGLRGSGTGAGKATHARGRAEPLGGRWRAGAVRVDQARRRGSRDRHRA